MTVTAVNDAPVAVDDTALTSVDVTSMIDLLSNDTDADPSDVLVIDSITQPSNGTVVDNGDGTVNYTPSNGFSGSDSFSYSVTDGNGEFASADVQVAVVSPGGDLPGGFISGQYGAEAGFVVFLNPSEPQSAIDIALSGRHVVLVLLSDLTRVKTFDDAFIAAGNTRRGGCLSMVRYNAHPSA